jgi:spermidine synthase
VTAPKPLPGWLATALVVGSSSAVLVLEILAGRLLAPYVGVTLETYTAVIGTVLAGIAVGAWAGGALADRHDPRRLLPVFLIVGGILAIASIPVVRLLGRAVDSSSGAWIILLTACAFLPNATVLSAVTPAVVKLQLQDLSTTGRTVGRLSAYGTAGAIVGTFLTGFVLVAWAAVTTLVIIIGMALVVAGVAMWFISPGRSSGDVLALVALTGAVLAGVAAMPSPCDVQTRYSCVWIVTPPDDPSRRVLILDDVEHSAVDLDDPTHLDFWYTRRFADAIAATAPAGPVTVVHIGGGGLTMPRYLRAVRPGSAQTVLEIDGDLVDVVDAELGYEPGPDVDIRIGDARRTLTGLADESADVVIGDAFGGRTVPWHLTTREFVEEIDRVLRPGGLYVVNLIDSGAQRFVRAEVATISSVFAHLAVAQDGPSADGQAGNAVVVASDGPLDDALLRSMLADAGDSGAYVGDLGRFVAGASVLTDDRAPVDQLIGS